MRSDEAGLAHMALLSRWVFGDTIFNGDCIFVSKIFMHHKTTHPEMAPALTISVSWSHCYAYASFEDNGLVETR